MAGLRTSGPRRALIAVAAAMVGLALAAGVPAQGAVRSSSPAVTVIVGATGSRTFHITATVSTAHPSSARVSWTVRRSAGHCVYFDTGNLTHAHGTTWTASGRVRAADLGSNDCAGPATLEVQALTSEGDDTFVGHVDLVRAARFVDVSVTPARVAAGHHVRVRGTLQRASWADRRNHAYLGHAVRLQLRPSDGTWRTVSTLAPAAHARYAVSVAVDHSGCWRLAATGSSTTAVAHGPAVCVRVR